MTAHAINLPQRRGACPGLSMPMVTGDGLLVRLTPVATIPLDAFAALCAAAKQHGNGIIEVTARGNIQVRGLSAESAPSFAATVAALDIAAADGIPVLCNPLAGLDAEEIIDAGALAADLHRELAQHSLAQKLSAKVSVVIDGGGLLNLDGIPADIRLRAEMFNGNAALQIGVGGDGTSAAELGIVDAAHGVEAVVGLLEVLVRRGRDSRARDILAAEGIAVFDEAFSSCPALCRASTPNQSTTKDVDGRDKPGHDGIGALRLRDGSFAYGVGLAFGHADATSLQRLIDAAQAAGASEMRTAPDRTLIAIGVLQTELPPFAAAAENLGFIVRGGDPRRHVVACAGAPVCAAAEIAARSIAPLIAATAAPHIDGSFKIHISGCAKGCAHPAPAALTIFGTSAGCAVVANGTTRDEPFKIVTTNDLPAAIEMLARNLKRENNHV
jgi:precorrin-3B synthase